MKEMKKIYKKPSAKEVKLDLSCILAGSPDINVDTDPDNGVNNMDAKGGIWYWMGEEE